MFYLCSPPNSKVQLRKWELPDISSISVVPTGQRYLKKSNFFQMLSFSDRTLRRSFLLCRLSVHCSKPRLPPSSLETAKMCSRILLTANQFRRIFLHVPTLAHFDMSNTYTHTAQASRTGPPAPAASLTPWGRPSLARRFTRSSMSSRPATAPRSSSTTSVRDVRISEVGFVKRFRSDPTRSLLYKDRVRSGLKRLKNRPQGCFFFFLFHWAFGGNVQSWALSVFFNLFTNIKWFFSFFIKWIWLGVGLFK